MIIACVPVPWPVGCPNPKPNWLCEKMAPAPANSRAWRGSVPLAVFTNPPAYSIVALLMTATAGESTWIPPQRACVGIEVGDGWNGLLVEIGSGATMVVETCVTGSV